MPVIRAPGCQAARLSYCRIAVRQGATGNVVASVEVTEYHGITQVTDSWSVTTSGQIMGSMDSDLPEHWYFVHGLPSCHGDFRAAPSRRWRPGPTDS